MAEQDHTGVEFTNLTEEDIKLESPFRMMITGSSHSGKSTFLLNLIKYRDLVLKEKFGRLIYCYPSDDASSHTKTNIAKMEEEFENLEIVRGLPDLDICKTGDHCLLLLDDLASEIANSKEMQKLFTCHSHHAMISVAFTTQNFYTKTNLGRDIPSNITHHVLFR
jgi:hypothetical protein